MVLLLFQTVCRLTFENQCIVANAKLCSVVFCKVKQSCGVKWKILHISNWSVVQKIPLLSGAVLGILKAKVTHRKLMYCSANTVQMQCKYSANAVQMQCKCSANEVEMQCKCSTNAVQMQCSVNQSKAATDTRAPSSAVLGNIGQ